ncbi:hypothetical protein [Puerhibacterium puerhi]|uniref:hypothetical protein n=1 Tax=Puerhibacterium puerhi TaxID=2692623 RepID=UPI00135862EC|nr:hypothetical protein [Puerhibacterium puerhi]
MSDDSPTRRQALVYLATAVVAGVGGYGWFAAAGPRPDDDGRYREDPGDDPGDDQDNGDEPDDDQDNGDEPDGDEPDDRSGRDRGRDRGRH